MPISRKRSMSVLVGRGSDGPRGSRGLDEAFYGNSGGSPATSPGCYIPGNMYTGEDWRGPCSGAGPRLVPVPSSGKRASDCTEQEKHEADNSQNPPNSYQDSNVENIAKD